MKFKGKISIIWYVIIGILNGIFVAGFVFSGYSTALLVSFVLLLVVDLYGIPVVFRNEVILNKKELIIHFGLLKNVLPVADIQAVRQLKDYSASYAADFQRVAIQCKHKTTVLISIEDETTLINELRKYNKKIKYIF